MKHVNKLKLSIIAFSAISSFSYAATQGTLGTTSTGDLVINATVANLMRVSNLTDISMGTFTGTGNLTGSDDFCVYRNGSGTYQITATGSGAANAFTITDGTNTMPYTVDFDNDITVAGGAVALTTGSAETGVSGANTASTDCNSGVNDNVSVDITIANADLASAPAGTYTGTLTLLVAPE